MPLEIIADKQGPPQPYVLSRTGSVEDYTSSTADVFRQMTRTWVYVVGEINTSAATMTTMAMGIPKSPMVLRGYRRKRYY